MNNNERLQELKVLQITEKNEQAIFSKHNLLMSWVDHVAPLLKYNNEHYSLFMDAALKVSVPGISSRTAIPCLNIMKSVVNRAIIELENNINLPMPNGTTKPATNITNDKHNWHEKPLGKIAIGILIAILSLFVIWIINHYFHLSL